MATFPWSRYALPIGDTRFIYCQQKLNRESTLLGIFTYRVPDGPHEAGSKFIKRGAWISLERESSIQNFPEGVKPGTEEMCQMMSRQTLLAVSSSTCPEIVQHEVSWRKLPIVGLSTMGEGRDKDWCGMQKELRGLKAFAGTHSGIWGPSTHFCLPVCHALEAD